MASQHSQGSAPDEEDEWLIVCRCEKAKSVYTLLSCLRNIGTLSGGSNDTNNSSSMTQSSSRRQQNASSTMQPVTVFCYPNSLSFHVLGKSKQIQASVNLQASLFSEYNLAQQDSIQKKTEDWHSEGEFCVNLPTVLQCLTLLGNLDRMKLTLSYNLTQELFQLELTDEAGVLSTASISGLQPPEDDDMTSLALAMRSSPIRARVIFQSAALREILVELDSVGGAKEGTVSLSSASLDISVVGDLSECQVSIPCRGEHVVSMECPAEGASHSFPLHSLLGSLRGLEIAHETCITINNNGMMAIQHQVIDPVTGDGSPCFVDFIMCCLDDSDDSSTTETPQEEAQSRMSQDMPESCSQSLTMRSLPKDDYSRTLSSTMGGLNDSEEEGTDDEPRADMPSAAPLFGSVVRKVGQTTEIPHRRRRAPSSNARKQRKSGHEADHMESSSDEEEELSALDVSTRRTNYADTDRGNTSSPELVYGREH